MNAPTTQLWWKEYRTLRPLWICLTIAAILLEFLIVRVMLNDLDAATTIYCVALGTAALYLVAAAITQFAGEREDGTITFLRRLPIGSLPVVRHKLGVAGVSALGLTAVLVGAGWFLTRGYLIARGVASQQDVMLSLVAIWGVAALECWAWATFLSLRAKRPLVAAVGALGLAGATAHGSSMIYALIVQEKWHAGFYASAAPLRLLIAAVVGFYAYRRAAEFLHPLVTTQAVSGKKTKVADIAEAERRPSAWPILGRLLWQTWRQAKWIPLAFYAVAVPVIVMAAGAAAWFDRSLVIFNTTTLTVIFSALMGACTFLIDQERNQKRFFAERGERARLVWLARLTFWSIATGILSFVVHLIWTAGAVHQTFGELTTDLSRSAHWWPTTRLHSSLLDSFVQSTEQILFWSPLISLSLVASLLGFAIGQFASMVIRSGILAGFLAAILSLLALGWSAAMWAWEIPFFWSVLPLPFIFLTATWLRAPDWLLSRHTWSSWLKPAAAILLPVSLLTFAVRANRLHMEIPRNMVEHSEFVADRAELQTRSQYTTPIETIRDAAARWDQEGIDPEAQQTADLYFRACDLMTTWDAFRGKEGIPQDEARSWRTRDGIHDAANKWVAFNQPAIELLLQATAREKCLFPTEHMRDARRYDQLSRCQNLLKVVGVLSTETGNLEEALKYFDAALKMVAHLRLKQPSRHMMALEWRFVLSGLTEWARAPNQEPELLKRAIDRIEILPQQISPPTASVIADFRQLHGRLEYQNFLLRLSHTLIPWEDKRAEKLLDYIMAERWRAISSASVRLGSPGEGVSVALRNIRHLGHGDRLQDRFLEFPWNELRSTYALRDTYQDETASLWGLIHGLATDEAARRMALLEISLISVRRKNAAARGDEFGQYPMSLADLKDLRSYNFYDPFSGIRFEYKPQGLDGWLINGDEIIPPGTPLLWKPSWDYRADSRERDHGDLREFLTERIALTIGKEGVTEWVPTEGKPIYGFITYPSWHPYLVTLPREDNLKSLWFKDNSGNKNTTPPLDYGYGREPMGRMPYGGYGGYGGGYESYAGDGYAGADIADPYAGGYAGMGDSNGSPYGAELPPNGDDEAAEEPDTPTLEGAPPEPE